MFFAIERKKKATILKGSRKKVGGAKSAPIFRRFDTDLFLLVRLFLE
jgi:hypothetical protein